MPAPRLIGLLTLTLALAAGADAQVPQSYSAATSPRGTAVRVPSVRGRTPRVPATGRTGRRTPVRVVSADPLSPTEQARLQALRGPWTFCGTLGSTCQFQGLRDVRLVNGLRTTLVATAFGHLPCAPDSFAGGASIATGTTRCEYGPMKLEHLANPRPAGDLRAGSVSVPIGAAGWDAPRTRGTGVTPLSTDGSGTFRTTCSLAEFRFHDPVGNPARVGPLPLYAFFGNTAAATVVRASIPTSGRSTCRGGTIDRSAYYLPAVVDHRSSDVQVPGDAQVHYSSGYNIDPSTVHAPPPGLVILAGDITARQVQRYVVEWTCRTKWMRNDGMIPSCPVGDAVRLWVHFPQCWDGRRLDSPNHRSHMAYPTYRSGARRSNCPSTHPVVLPAITQVLEYEVRAGSSPRNWRLTTDNYTSRARGGLSAHAYWVGGWDQPTLNTFVSECLVRGVDCGMGFIGRGTELY